jgi:hypothetical protein
VTIGPKLFPFCWVSKKTLFIFKCFFCRELFDFYRNHHFFCWWDFETTWGALWKTCCFFEMQKFEEKNYTFKGSNMNEVSEKKTNFLLTAQNQSERVTVTEHGRPFLSFIIIERSQWCSYLISHRINTQRWNKILMKTCVGPWFCVTQTGLIKIFLQKIPITFPILSSFFKINLYG